MQIRASHDKKAKQYKSIKGCEVSTIMPGDGKKIGIAWRSKERHVLQGHAKQSIAARNKAMQINAKQSEQNQKEKQKHMQHKGKHCIAMQCKPESNTMLQKEGNRKQYDANRYSAKQ